MKFEGERKSYEGTCGQSLLGRGTSKCKGPGVSTYSGSSEARDSGEWQQAKPLEAMHAWLLLVLVMKTHMLDYCQSPWGRAVTHGLLSARFACVWSFPLVPEADPFSYKQRLFPGGWGLGMGDGNPDQAGRMEEEADMRYRKKPRWNTKQPALRKLSKEQNQNKHLRG